MALLGVTLVRKLQAEASTKWPGLSSSLQLYVSHVAVALHRFADELLCTALQMVDHGSLVNVFLSLNAFLGVRTESPARWGGVGTSSGASRSPRSSAAVSMTYVTYL